MNDTEYRSAQYALFEALSQGSALASFVPLRKNYERAALCLTIVHLIERALANAIARQIVNPLREVEPCHHWYPTNDLHITVKNIKSARTGRIYTPQEVQRAVDALHRAAPELSALEFEIVGVICLPTSIVVCVFGTLAHRRAILALDQILTSLGMADDKQYISCDVFVSNITICRFTEEPTAELKARVAEYESVSFGAYCVDTLQLVQCDEVCSTASRVIHSSLVLPNKFDLKQGN